MDENKERNKTLLYAALGVGALLVLFLFFDSGATIGLVEQLLTYALAGVIGYYIVTSGVRIAAGN